MSAILLLGFLIGMRHALEADHLAAVGSLADGRHSLRRSAWQGAVWGMGHTLTLLLFGGAVLLLDTLVPERYALLLETLVGMMLILLGADLLRRLYRDRVHFHLHRHDGIAHIHAHSHRGASHPHHQDPHHHAHPPGFPLRALLVGMTHGLAGSAALVVLALGSVHSLGQGLLYILLFGAGSIVGMGLLAATIAVPFRYLSERGMNRGYRLLQLLVAVVTVGMGGSLVYTGVQAGVLS